MKGTRLWNQPRSPLIQGRSNRERPFWADWLVAFLIGSAVGAVVAAALLMPEQASILSGVEAAAVPALLGAAGGAFVGVPLAAGFGWHPRWVSGAVLAGVLSTVAVWVAHAL